MLSNTLNPNMQLLQNWAFWLSLNELIDSVDLTLVDKEVVCWFSLFRDELLVVWGYLLIIMLIFLSGWHICSVCRKASSYMCYTCTNSWCKSCIKNEEFVCVRGNKGFCSTCIKPIMLIENKDQAANDSVWSCFF